MNLETLRFSNYVWDSFDTQTDEMEDRSFQTEIEDIKLNRTNPPRYDKRKDQTNELNENKHDSDVSNRYDQTSLTSSKNVFWRKVLAWGDLPITPQMRALYYNDLPEGYNKHSLTFNKFINHISTDREFVEEYLEGLLESSFTDGELLRIWRTFYYSFPQWKKLLKDKMFDMEGNKVPFEKIEIKQE